MRHILYIIVCTLSLSLHAQDTNVSISDSLIKDSTAFKMYLDGTTFAECYPMSLLQSVFKYRHRIENDSTCRTGDLYSQTEANNYEPSDHAQTFWGPQVWTDTKMIGVESSGVSSTFRDYDDIQFPDSIRRLFVGYFYRYKHAFPKKKALAQSLVYNLRQFKNNATHLPTFYATIAHDYKGSIDAYVNDMLKKSILLDIGRHDRFLRKPSSFKMANDLGVQFVIGIALYRLWMKEQTDK